jgi:hypothetical protein
VQEGVPTFETMVMALVFVFVTAALATNGCRVVDNCNGPALVCYDNYGDCICANGKCVCDGMCGPAWWLIVIFVVLFLLAILGVVLCLRRCCRCFRGRGYSSVN